MCEQWFFLLFFFFDMKMVKFFFFLSFFFARGTGCFIQCDFFVCLVCLGVSDQWPDALSLSLSHFLPVLLKCKREREGKRNVQHVVVEIHHFSPPKHSACKIQSEKTFFFALFESQLCSNATKSPFCFSIEKQHFLKPHPPLCNEVRSSLLFVLLGAQPTTHS